jgi:hypothetical protein
MIKHSCIEHRAVKRGGEGARRRVLAPTFPRSLAFCSLLLAFSSLLSVTPSLAQTYQEDTQPAPEVYHESALRRFEIVFTISLPFTALHSYLAVRGVGMLRQRKVSPELHRADWNAVGGLTILFSGFVAFWDYLQTRGEDISETTITPRERNSGYSMLNTGHWMISSKPSNSSKSLKPWNDFDDLNAFDSSIEHRISSIQYPASSIQYPLILLSIGF